MTKTAELREFVSYQAVEDAVLPSGERAYQAQLVRDVLTQEAPNSRTFKVLIELYHAKQSAA